MDPKRIVSIGLGPIGLAAAKIVLERPSLALVGAADRNPAIHGRELADLLGRDRPTGVVIEADAERVLQALHPDVLLLCTSSRLLEIERELRAAVTAGVDVLSSCEELLMPELDQPRLTRELDEAARLAGVTIVGTGVNPGFVLDFLPVIASAPCRVVHRVRGLRVVDAASRRLPLQRKIGVGLTPTDFRQLAKRGEIGHVGLRHSVALIGSSLGFSLDSVSQTVEAIIAEAAHTTPNLTVEAGQVAGIRNLGWGRSGDETRVELSLEMYVGAPEPRDEIFIEGEPSMQLRLEGGVPGDLATAAILVNSVRSLVAAAPGLQSVLDLPPPRARS